MMLTPDQIASIQTLEDLACFFLSFRQAANGLYNAWLMAEYLRSQGKFNNYGFCYMGQSIRFSGCQLIFFEQSVRCATIQELVNGSDTLEGVAKLLFKLRIPLTKLYATYAYALDARSRGVKYVYVFTNPFEGISGSIGQITGSLTMTYDCIIDLFCSCSQLQTCFNC